MSKEAKTDSPALQDLNPRQQAAVQITSGPLLILAGAGSGKTKTLVHRIAYLIAEQGVKPYNILAVTFTNKAANEMKERVARLLGVKNFQQILKTQFGLPTVSSRLPAMGTFHSICVKILRREIEHLGYKTSFNIYDEADSQATMKRAILNLRYNPKQFTSRNMAYHISNAKNELIDAEQYAASASGYLQEVVARVYQEYLKLLRESNALDFDDLLMLTVKLWQKYPAKLKAYQELFQYVMVDEYQDTNHAQFVFISLVAKKHQNICVVGDDWQSIYAWRGATIRNILEFERDYPRAKVVLLEQNYRSSKIIVEAGNQVIRGNKNQKKKKLWTANEAGERIKVVPVEDERAEAEFIVREILGLSQKDQGEETEEVTYEFEAGESVLERVMRQSQKDFSPSIRSQLDIKRRLKDKNISLNDYVILYRTNAQSRALEEVFLLYGVPYKIVGGLRFYERREIKDILAYLKVLVSAEDILALERIINTPPRGIGERTFLHLLDYSKDNKIGFLKTCQEAKKIGALRQQAVEPVIKFGRLMASAQKTVKSLTPARIIDTIVSQSGYKEYILDGTSEGESRWENIQELKTVAAKYGHLRGQQGLQNFLEEVSLLSDIDELDRYDQQSVTMMTIHAAKGLEFPVVFLAGMEEGLFPHSRSLIEPKEMEEERRLCYVGITRAKKRLYFIYATQRTLYGSPVANLPSRFLQAIPDKLIQ